MLYRLLNYDLREYRKEGEEGRQTRLGSGVPHVTRFFKQVVPPALNII